MSKVKTFEEEMRSIIAKARFGTTINRYEEMPEYIQKEIDIAVNDVLAAHQAEMDRVLDEVIGGDPFVPSGMTLEQRTQINAITQCKTAQRARYKAIKERK